MAVEGLPELGPFPILQTFGGIMVLLVTAILWKRGERLGQQQPAPPAASKTEPIDFQIQIEESARNTRQLIYEHADKVEAYLGAQIENLRRDVQEWRNTTTADIATLMERTRRGPR